MKRATKEDQGAMNGKEGEGVDRACAVAGASSQISFAFAATVRVLIVVAVNEDWIESPVAIVAVGCRMCA